MPNPTLRDIVETFTEEELSLTIPIEFQDVSAGDYQYVNEYNRLLAANDYQSAYNYRIENSDKIEKYIFDAKKMNYLQTLVINAYMFAKGEKSAVNTSYDNTISKITADTVQEAIDVVNQNLNSVSSNLNNQLGGYTIRKVSTLPSSPNSKTIYLVTG